MAKVGDLPVGCPFRYETEMGAVLAQGVGSTTVQFTALETVEFETLGGEDVRFRRKRRRPVTISKETEVEVHDAR